MYSDVHSILGSIHKCHSCTDRARHNVHRMAIDHTDFQSIRHCSDTFQIRTPHSVHNLNCIQLQKRNRTNNGNSVGLEMTKLANLGLRITWVETLKLTYSSQSLFRGTLANSHGLAEAMNLRLLHSYAA